TIAINKNGVTLPITAITLSSFNVIANIIRITNSKLPTNTGNPNCWFNEDPAPATITTPTPNKVKIKIASTMYPNQRPLIVRSEERRVGKAYTIQDLAD